jgi:hypothetical protein
LAGGEVESDGSRPGRGAGSLGEVKFRGKGGGNKPPGLRIPKEKEKTISSLVGGLRGMVLLLLVWLLFADAREAWKW